MMTAPNKSKLAPAEKIPDAVRLALVPIANPATASELLHLASAIVAPQDGKVVALVVSLGDVEAEAKAVKELQEILDDFKAEGHKFQLENVVSTSIARGILDTARELGADLIMLGIKQPVRGEVVLGTVVENVVNTAPCDVLIYRTAGKAVFDRIVVPVNSSYQAQIAARMGIRLAGSYDVPVEAIHVQAGHEQHYEGLAHIEAAIADMPGRENVKRTVITAQNVVESILARTTEGDLIIVGFSVRSQLERWMFGDVSRGVLDRAPGPVILVSRALGNDNRAERMRRRFMGWLRPTLTRVEQDEIIRQAQENSWPSIDYIMLIIVSATLASLGLLLNSAAVIIGAMLVAPLMGPLIALSTGLTVGRVGTSRRGVGTLMLGVLLAILVAVIIGLLLPANLPTQEMLARGRPTLLDAGVALASGIVGAYATARKDIPAALAGVAIAAALMPPICTIGLGLAFGDSVLAYGATVLFLTNVICIIVAGMAVFFWLGMRLRSYPQFKPRTQLLALLLLFVCAVPVGWELISLTQQVNEESAIQRELRAALAPAEVTGFDITRSHPMNVVATVRTSRDLTSRDVAEIENRLNGLLGRAVHVELIVQQVIRLSVEPEEDEEDEAP